MGKRIGIWISILAAGGIFLCWLSLTMWQGRSQVVITEQVIYGDSSLAEGLTIRSYNMCQQYEDTLYWETIHTLGQENQCETRLPAAKEIEARERVSQETDSFALNWLVPYFRAGSYYRIWTERLQPPAYTLDEYAQASHEVAGLRAAIEAVVSRCGNNEFCKETVSLSDYYEYYPLYVCTQGVFEDLYYQQNGTCQKLTLEEWDRLLEECLRDYLRVPVSETECVSIGVRKNGEGKIENLSVDSDFSNNLYSITTPQGIYFLATTVNSGPMLDYSQIPGGYGVYYIPFITEGAYCLADLDGITTLCSLDQTLQIETFTVNEEGTYLAVCGWKEEAGKISYDLTVIDTESGRKLTFADLENQTFHEWISHSVYTPAIVLQEDYMVLETWEPQETENDDLPMGSEMESSETEANCCITLYQLASDGICELRIHAPVYATVQTPEDMVPYINIENGEIAYNGEYLVLFSPMNMFPGSSGRTCDWYLTLYGETEAVYAAILENSLSSGQKTICGYSDEGWPCVPFYENPLDIIWN